MKKQQRFKTTKFKTTKVQDIQRKVQDNQIQHNKRSRHPKKSSRQPNSKQLRFKTTKVQDNPSSRQPILQIQQKPQTFNNQHQLSEILMTNSKSKNWLTAKRNFQILLVPIHGIDPNLEGLKQISP